MRSGGTDKLKWSRAADLTSACCKKLKYLVITNWLITHLNQGQRFDGELHIVHYNTKYRQASIIVEYCYCRKHLFFLHMV